jgi:long-chain acyl-CoA synthetase
MTTLLAPTQDRETTLLSVWEVLAERYPQVTALLDPHKDPKLELSYGELFDRIRAFAGGLQSLGIQPGDRVAIFADNCPRWLMADLGSMFMGAVNVPRSGVADPQELAFILRHTGCTALIAENLKTLERVQDTVSELCIDKLILLSDEVPPSGINYLAFEQLLARGREHGFTPPALKRSDLATIIHTSGTSGNPKGVMLTHGNLMHQVESAEVVVQPQPGNRVLTILPTWHSYERSCEYFLLSRGCTLVYTDPRHLKKDLKQYPPHFLIAVPRIWESLYEGITKQFQEKSPLMQKLIQFFLQTSERYVIARRIARGHSILHLDASPLQRWGSRLQSIGLLPLHLLADKLVYAKVRQAIGSDFQHAISGGGSLPAYLDLFYEIVGISILNGYGLTETSPILAGRRPDLNVRGTVGPPLPQTELKVVDPETGAPVPQGQRGLIMGRGPQVMQGYYNNPEATDKVLSLDGWFNTGDLGWLTPDGQLVITGRAKDTIVLLNGENIEPQPLEDVCSQSPYIQQIVIVGQDQKQLGALIYPHLDALKQWATDQGIPVGSGPEDDAILLASGQVRDLIKAELRQRIRQRPGYRPDDQVGDFRFLPEPLSIENGLMTQTLKIRRLQVTDHYQALIAEMFGPTR